MERQILWRVSLMLGRIIKMKYKKYFTSNEDWKKKKN